MTKITFSQSHATLNITCHVTVLHHDHTRAHLEQQRNKRKQTNMQPQSVTHFYLYTAFLLTFLAPAARASFHSPPRASSLESSSPSDQNGPCWRCLLCRCSCRSCFRLLLDPRVIIRSQCIKMHQGMLFQMACCLRSIVATRRGRFSPKFE